MSDAKKPLGSSTSITSYRQCARNERAIRHEQPVSRWAMTHILAGGALLCALPAVTLAVLASSHR
jgi:hypothetical protein